MKKIVLSLLAAIMIMGGCLTVNAATNHHERVLYDVIVRGREYFKTEIVGNVEIRSYKNQIEKRYKCAACGLDLASEFTLSNEVYKEYRYIY